MMEEQKEEIGLADYFFAGMIFLQKNNPCIIEAQYKYLIVKLLTKMC